MELLRNAFLAWNDQQPTSIEYDQQKLESLSSKYEETARATISEIEASINALDIHAETPPVQIDSWHVQCAIVYRLTRKLIVRYLVQKLGLLLDVLEKIEESEKRIETEHVSDEVRTDFRKSMHSLIVNLAEERLYVGTGKEPNHELHKQIEDAKQKYKVAPKESCGMYIGVSIYGDFLDYFDAKYLSEDILEGLT